MKKLYKQVQLQNINYNDFDKLHKLMCKIYPSEYNDFWLDDCSWYINNQYSKKNIGKELQEENQLYYFVTFENKTIGILRLLINKPPKNTSEKYMKLHRIYLDNKYHNLGLGTIVLNKVTALAKRNNCTKIWLEAMEKKPLAINFYQKNGFKKIDEYLYEFSLLKKEYQKMIAFCKEL